MGTIAFGTASILVNIGIDLRFGNRARARVVATALEVMSDAHLCYIIAYPMS